MQFQVASTEPSPDAGGGVVGSPGVKVTRNAPPSCTLTMLLLLSVLDTV